MAQTVAPHDRRTDTRLPVAFAFWFTRPESVAPAGGWMVNYSTGGAAFLCAAGDAPAIGEFVELREMFSSDAHVRGETPTLPGTAEVLRIESPNGATQQVAVRFAERPAAALLNAPPRKTRADVSSAPTMHVPPIPGAASTTPRILHSHI